MKTTKQWMVIDASGELYAASNAHTQTDAKERHYADIGEPWPTRHRHGDRLVRVTITIEKTLP
jgi:hypothetical protein